MEKFYSIKEFSELTNLSPHTLRYYEKIGIIFDVIRKNGIRTYSDKNLNWLFLLKKLKNTGMNIKDIQYYVKLYKLGDSTLPIRLDILQKHHKHILARIKEDELFLKNLEKKINFYNQKIKALNIEK